MTIGGFWHGADYTFIAWGFYWGVLLAVERYLETSLGWKLTPNKNFVLKIVKVWIVFLLFSFGAILFRANNANMMIQHVFGIFENVPNKIETELIFSSLSWLGNAGSLIDGNSFFLLNQMENLEKFFYLFWVWYFSIGLSMFQIFGNDLENTILGYLHSLVLSPFFCSLCFRKIRARLSIINFRKMECFEIDFF